jgi:hypothetical protein
VPGGLHRSAAVAASSAALVFAVCLLDLVTWSVEIGSDGETVTRLRRRLARRASRTALMKTTIARSTVSPLSGRWEAAGPEAKSREYGSAQEG